MSLSLVTPRRPLSSLARRPSPGPWSLPLLLTTGLAASICGCGGTPNSLEPAYEGCATDENWQTVDDRRQSNAIKTDAARAAQWIVPATEGQGVPAGAPLALRWAATAAVPGTDAGDVTCSGAALLPLTTSSAPLSALLPHLPPISGTVYDVQFRVASKVVYRALTTRQTTTVTAAMLTGWKGQGVQLDMVSAKLLNNDIAEGPFQAPLRTINVQ